MENLGFGHRQLNLRIGTFREDIFSKPDDAYEFDVMFYYDSGVYPMQYYYDNIDYKYKNTIDTLAHHILAGNAEDSLWQILDAMEDDGGIYLVGLNEPICTKAGLFNYIKELKKENDN